MLHDMNQHFEYTAVCYHYFHASSELQWCNSPTVPTVQSSYARLHFTTVVMDIPINDYQP